MNGDDRLAILELSARYCNMVDDKQWEALDLIFTSDAIFDSSAFGRPVQRGLEEIRDLFSTMDHPLAHHISNTMLDLVDADTVRVHSKWLVLFPERIVSGDYHDVVVRAAAGWRIREKIVTPRVAVGEPRPGRPA